jgi:hypothetical protein
MLLLRSVKRLPFYHGFPVTTCKRAILKVFALLTPERGLVCALKLWSKAMPKCTRAVARFALMIVHMPTRIRGFEAIALVCFL